MFLKRITLSGFKSFADRVDFDFGRGVTCIVGPNGCGKSNVLDAFKWVLGEQSARSLRGRQMLDMIFSGSSTRRSSSVAQVDLLFGNDDRTLGLDQDEITVTRKLYRSGECDYLLNNQSARLKDIRELFMDTGVGVDSYSVIEQGKVDSLLQSSPTERRIIFEEAAGISKYKARKREAQRKLDRTQQNLLRVEDVVEELERRLRSVKLQAGKARNYKQYEARLNELRSTYVLAEYHRLVQASDRLRREVADHDDRATGLRTEIGRMEAEEAEAGVRLDALGEDIALADNQLVQAKSDCATQTERIESALRRVDEQHALAERGAERMATDRQRLRQANEELETAQASTEGLETQTAELRQTIDRLTEQDGSLAREMTRLQAVYEDEKAGIIDLLRQSAQAHNEVVRLNSQRESLIGQKGRLSARDAQIAGELETHLEDAVGLRQQLRECEDKVDRQTDALEQKKNEAGRIDGVRQRIVDELAALKEKRSALVSRQELLSDLQENMDGVETGVRQLLETRAERQDDTAGHDDSAGHDDPNGSVIVGLVADLIDTDVAHARIIESLLGERDQHVVVSDGKRFVSHVERVDDLTGRVTAICLDRLPPVYNERDFSGEAGFVSRAIDLVRVPSAYEQLALHLFAKTIVVTDLATAMLLADRDAAGHRFVTKAGEVIEADGRIRLGPAGAATGLISRRSELRDIEARLMELERGIERLGDQLNRTAAEADYLETIQQELRTAIYQANTAKVEANAALQKVEETVERLTGEKPLIAREVALIDQQVEDVLERSQEGGETVAALERENLEREARASELQQDIDKAVEQRRELQEQLTETKVSVGQLTEKRAAAAEVMASTQRLIRELETAVEAAEHDIAQCRSRAAEAEHSVVSAKERITELESRIQTLQHEADTLRTRRESLRGETEQRGKGLKDTRRRLEEVEAEHHRCDMALAESSVRRDELVARVKDELDVDLAARYAECEGGEQDWEQDWEQVETEIGELRKKISRLGNVNLGAIDELAELEERHGFLTGQRDDLTESRKQLEQLILRLDTESKARFTTAFTLIRDNFRALFRKLFGGGKADIILEDPDNTLECGIEIVAQPPGKDLQVISLMSGGEKSLTAIALLMSIFKCRPAPFAILDEVDAALDEANNERFNRIIQEFVSESQFIIITHSKRTMSIGDQLYGVTMQEPGVSTRVGVQLADADVA